MGRWTAIVVIGLASGLGVGGRATAEVPAREELRQVPLVTRYAWFKDYYDVDEWFGGIWRFDPASLEFNRLRPFLDGRGSDGYIPPGVRSGNLGTLGVHGDVVSYRLWPAELQFDLLSWRLERRLQVAAADDGYGWTVFGRRLAEADAATLGLSAGVYGVGRCFLTPLTAVSDWAAPKRCEPWPYPAGSAALKDSTLLFQAGLQATATTAWVADLPSWQWLSDIWAEPAWTFDLDPGRGGAWTATPDGAQLVPVADGILGTPEPPIGFSFPPFGGTEVRLLNLFYNPPGDLFYGVVFDGLDGRARVFEADPDTGDGTVLAEWPPYDLEGAPGTWAGVGTPPTNREQLVPIVGGGPGAHGTDWRTELWLYNPSDAPTTASLRRVTRPQQLRELTVPAHGSVAIADALDWLGGGPDGDGTRHEAVVVTAPARWGRELVAFGRISTPDPATGGRFGHAVTAAPTRFGYSNHLQFLDNDADHPQGATTIVDPAYLELDLSPTGRFRANVGVVNDLDVPITLGFAFTWAFLRSFDWVPERFESLEVAPHSVELVALDELFPPDIVNGFPPQIAVTGDRPAAVWLSVIDNLTGDATFVPFTTFQVWNDRDDDRLVLPAAARLPGRHSTTWRTDLVGVQWHVAPFSDVVMRYRPADPATACNGAALTPGGIAGDIRGEIGMPLDAWLTTLYDITGRWIPAGTATTSLDTVFRDIVGAFWQCADDGATKGALEVAMGNWTAGYSRTYTTRADGGTYGSMLPFYPPGGWPVQHFAGLEVDDAQRINLDLYNGLEQPVTHRLLLYAADGALAASAELELGPHEHRQAPLAAFLGMVPDGLYGLTVIPLDDPTQGIEGRSWAYVSIVDNLTNDPVNLW